MNAQQLPDPTLPWPIAMPAVALIADQEGLRLRAYRCPAGVPSIAYGETDGVHMGDTCTKQQADHWLCDDLIARAQSVQGMCIEWANENQLGALVSLAYNIGLEGLKKSTVLRLHNSSDFDGAARAFDLFNKYRDPKTKQLVVSSGLTARRKAEAALYLTPTEETPHASIPQAVAPESSLAASPINAGGAVAAGGGLMTILSQYGDQANGVLATLKTAAADLGVQLPVVLGGVLLVAGVVVVVQRIRQRAGGWA